MGKINEEILHRTNLSVRGIPIYYCATVGPWEDLRLFEGLSSPVDVMGSERLEALTKGMGFDTWLNYRCDLAKVMLHKSIDKKFERIWEKQNYFWDNRWFGRNVAFLWKTI